MSSCVGVCMFDQLGITRQYTNNRTKVGKERRPVRRDSALQRLVPQSRSSSYAGHATAASAERLACAHSTLGLKPDRNGGADAEAWPLARGIGGDEPHSPARAAGAGAAR